MDKFFKLKENNTTVRTEIAAGLTTFFAMAYIVFVNPNQVAAGGAGGSSSAGSRGSPGRSSGAGSGSGSSSAGSRRSPAGNTARNQAGLFRRAGCIP